MIRTDVIPVAFPLLAATQVINAKMMAKNSNYQRYDV